VAGRCEGVPPRTARDDRKALPSYFPSYGCVAPIGTFQRLSNALVARLGAFQRLLNALVARLGAFSEKVPLNRWLLPAGKNGSRPKELAAIVNDRILVEIDPQKSPFYSLSPVVSVSLSTAASTFSKLKTEYSLNRLGASVSPFSASCRKSYVPSGNTGVRS